ncbi:MAG: dTDP-4-dehydrorhamnose reductase [Acidobacteria bacterium]|nr:dTDP-4-dehydrorhamnose reductase [Acidobacteriota bacterium]
MKVLVTGGNGQLARAIAETWTGDELRRVDVEDFDLGTPGAAAEAVEAFRPQVVVSAGAWTAVDACEADPSRADLVNGRAVGWLGEACEAQGALLVHLSTDYVFDGHSLRPYLETDPAAPATAYGRSKLLGEQEALRAKEHLVLRTAWLYESWGNNFLRTMLRMAREGRSLKVVDDQFGSPTSCRALARQIRSAVDEGWRGLFHATCGGETSWYGFAREIFRQAGLEPALHPCTSAAFQRPAPRPGFTVLDNAKRLAAGRNLMPHWREALAEVLASGVED